MKLDLRGKKFCIFGVQGSGKTIFSKHVVAKNFRSALVFTPHPHEWQKLKNVYIWTTTGDLRKDFEQVCAHVKTLALEKKIDAFIIDEMDMFVGDNFNIGPNFLDLTLNHRHYPESTGGLALGGLSRRPQDIPTKYVESCHYVFIFKVEGANIFKKFRDISPAINPQIEKLVYQDYRFIVKPIGKDPYIMEKVKLE